MKAMMDAGIRATVCASVEARRLAHAHDVREESSCTRRMCVKPGQADAPDAKEYLKKYNDRKERGIEMTPRTAEPSPRLRARVAGLLYLIGSVAGVFGILYGPSLIVPGDAKATASTILAHASLFRLSIVSALLDQMIFILVVLVLYQVLKPVNQNMAVLMVIFLLLSVPIAMLNELNNVAVLFLLSGAHSLKVFTAAQLHALVPFFLDLHALGLNIAFLVGSLWFFPMGYLVFKSGYLPKILGVLLLMNGVGYLIDSFAALLFPNLNVNIVLFTGWVEVVFALWLLMKGVNVERWEKRARESA